MDGQTVLAGAIPGRRVLSGLIAATPSSAAPTPVFLDFTAIQIATASFLREAVIGFRDYARQSLRNVYPAVANLAPAVAEELDFFVRARGDAMWSCELDSGDTVISAQLIREPHLRPALDLRSGDRIRGHHRTRARGPLRRPTNWADRLE